MRSKLLVQMAWIAAAFTVGFCAGHRAAKLGSRAELAQCQESKRMAIDAAVAKSIMTEPSPHECALAAEAVMERAGFVAVHFEGMR